jgi:alkylation response protein AidB-like acyl-CoA dehydrogenase
MDFRVGDDQRELAQGIRSVVQSRLPLERLRAREGDEHTIGAREWADLGETGVFALTLREPEGTGLGLPDATVVFEELGRALVPGPLVGTFLAACAGVADGAAEGKAQVGVHCAGGPALLVLAPDAPAQVVSPAPVGGARRVDHPLDPLTPLWLLGALPFGGSLPDDDGRLWRDGALLTAALQVGHAAAALDLAVAYAKERHQFGNPIGAFQAVKHMCADMLVRAEVARAAVHAAACLADAPDVARSEAEAAGCAPRQLLARSVAGAKLMADEAALANARASIQVHGGMGFTWEVPLHLHLKRALVLSTNFGTPAELSADLAAYA